MEELENWCECEEQGDAFFHDDEETPMDSCVLKHHYHCGRCLRLVQIG